MSGFLTLLGVIAVIGIIVEVAKISMTAKQIAEPGERKKHLLGIVAEMRQKLGSRALPMAEKLRSISTTHSSPVAIYSVGLKTPDSASGCDAYFGFVNTSEKTIKYVKFGGKFINAVGDEIACSIRGVSKRIFQLTGPAEPGAGSFGVGDVFEASVYGPTVSGMQLTYVSIEFMDGTITLLDGDSLEKAFLDPNLNNPLSELQRELVVVRSQGKLDVFYKQIFERMTSVEFADQNIFELL